MASAMDALKADVNGMARTAYELGAMNMKVEICKFLSSIGLHETCVTVCDFPLPPIPEHLK